MTSYEKDNVLKMRNEGLSYSKIASSLGISENTVKALCRRSRLSAACLKDACQQESPSEEMITCLHCAKPLTQNPMRKRKKFCSDVCRVAWWIANKDMKDRGSVCRFTCAGCGKPFESYGNRGRKYCGHACYINHRFKTAIERKDGDAHVKGAI